MQSRNGLNCLSNENERRSTTRLYLGSWRSLNTKLRVWRSRCEPLFELKLEVRAGSPLAGRHPGLFPEKAAEIMFVVEADFEGDSLTVRLVCASTSRARTNLSSSKY